MSKLINQKFIEGIDSSKFKIAANGALMAVDGSGNLVELLKLNPSGAALLLGVEVASKSALESLVSDLTAHIASNEASFSEMDGRLDSIESEMPNKASVSYVNEKDEATLAASKLYADQRVSDLVNGAPEILDTLKEISDALGGDANLAGTLTGQISSVQSGLTSEISRATAAEIQVLSDSKAYTDQKVSDEASTRSAADDAKLVEAKAYTDQKVSDEASARESADNAKLLEAKSYADSKVSDEATARAAADSAEQSARQAADASLQSDMDDLDAYAQDIRADLDQEILDRQSAVSSEAAARVAGDAAEQSAREAAISAEAAARESADEALDGRVTVLENKPAIELKNKYGVLGSGDLMHIDLDHKVRENGIIALYVDRTIVYPGMDYTLSEVGGKTRITWAGELANPDGSYAVVEGDDFYCVYAI
jgi:hypothetical protein